MDFTIILVVKEHMLFKVGTPTTIGLPFNGTTITLNFYKDEIDLEVSFSNLGKITDPLYPIISSSACQTQIILSSR